MITIWLLKFCSSVFCFCVGEFNNHASCPCCKSNSFNCDKVVEELSGFAWAARAWREILLANSSLIKLLWCFHLCVCSVFCVTQHFKGGYKGGKVNYGTYFPKPQHILVTYSFFLIKWIQMDATLTLNAYVNIK